jgi:peptidoglycan hydrolase-like protein with peptidoglycan-binding domain
MLKSRIRTLALAVATITSVTAAVTLSTTTASAATMTASAPSHVTAPRAAEATGCVTQTFAIWDENTYERCVRDEQILFNDLWSLGKANVTQHLTVDGYYGPETFSVVVGFQEFENIGVDGITGPQTWFALCVADWDLGFTGAYWHDAGCNTEPGIFT